MPMAARKKRGQQPSLPGVVAPEPGADGPERSRRRIPVSRILETLLGGSEGGRGIIEIYRMEVLPIKARTVYLLGRKCPARIIHTLLGYEVQAWYKRIQCPDLVTARYLKLFTELGCGRIRLPYDPTVTGRLIPELEAAQERLAEGVKRLFPRDRARQLYVLRSFYGLIRSKLRCE